MTKLIKPLLIGALATATFAQAADAQPYGNRWVRRDERRAIRNGDWGRARADQRIINYNRAMRNGYINNGAYGNGYYGNGYFPNNYVNRGYGNGYYNSGSYSPGYGNGYYGQPYVNNGYYNNGSYYRRHW